MKLVRSMLIQKVTFKLEKILKTLAVYVYNFEVLLQTNLNGIATIK